MDSLFNVLSTVGSVCGIFGTLIAWVALKNEQRAELKKILKAIWTHSTKVVPVLMALFTTVASVWEIYLFGTAENPPTRKDILELLMHCWNAASYFFFGMVLFSFWLKDFLAKEYPVQAQT